MKTNYFNQMAHLEEFYEVLAWGEEVWDWNARSSNPPKCYYWLSLFTFSDGSMSNHAHKFAFFFSSIFQGF